MDVGACDGVFFYVGEGEVVIIGGRDCDCEGARQGG